MKVLLASTILFFSHFSMAQLQPMDLSAAQNLLNSPLPIAIEQSLQKTPAEYSFFNSMSESTVNYSGQVMRQVLIDDSKLGFLSLKMGSTQGKPNVAAARLNSYYLYNFETDGEEQYLVKAKDESGSSVDFWEGVFYSSIFPRDINLKSKMAGVDNSLRHGKLLGWNLQKISGVVVDSDGDGQLAPAELYEAMMQATVQQASGVEKFFEAPNGSLEAQKIDSAYITKEGLDLSQLSQKLLHVAVSFSQAAGDYTSVDLDPSKKKGLLADNDTLLENRSYTTLQHHWDEAFGYFGAARNYTDYTDDQIASGISLDNYESQDVEDPNSGALLYTNQIFGNGDGDISISGEKNLGISVNAAKRDKGIKLKNEDFTLNTFSAFLKGRQLIQDRPEGYLKYAQAHAVVAMHEWERVIAATSIHYINKTIADLESYGTADYQFSNLAKHWSELKGFALGFQFNPNSEFFKNSSSSDFLQLHQWIGDRPVNPATEDVKSYIDQLKKGRDLLGRVYKFDPVNIEVM